MPANPSSLGRRTGFFHRKPGGADVDAGYRGHDVPRPGRVFRSGQKRGVHGQIKKELRRRSAIARPTDISDATSSRAAQATISTPS